MALKDWWDVPYTAADCMRDHNQWNSMVEYVKHSSCTDFTIHSTCTSGGQAFRFSQTGTLSQMYGGANTSDDLEIRANDTDIRCRIKLHGGSDMWLDSGDDIFMYENGVQMFKFNLNGAMSEIIGGTNVGDDISIQPNSAVGAPKLIMYGNSDSYYEIPTGQKFHWRSGFTTFLDLYESGTDDIIEGKTAGNDLYLKPVGLVKFGTYAAITTETLQGFVTIKDNAGNQRKVAIVA